MRLEVTRKAELAVRAMRALHAAGPGASPARVKAPAMATALGTTSAFVPQVMNPLVKAGWVRSDPGPTGGYVLVQPPVELSVLDVIEAVDGPTDAGRCVVDGRECDAEEPCVLHRAWSEARAELLRVLRAEPLAETPT